MSVILPGIVTVLGKKFNLFIFNLESTWAAKDDTHMDTRMQVNTRKNTEDGPVLSPLSLPVRHVLCAFPCVFLYLVFCVLD